MEILPECGLHEPEAARTFRGMTWDGVRGCAFTVPSLPRFDVLDEHLIASLIMRRLRAGRDPGNTSIRREGSIPPRPNPCGEGVRPRAITDDRWPEAVHSLLAELACRRVDALAVEESS